MCCDGNHECKIPVETQVLMYVCSMDGIVLQVSPGRMSVPTTLCSEYGAKYLPTLGILSSVIILIILIIIYNYKNLPQENNL